MMRLRSGSRVRERAPKATLTYYQLMQTYCYPLKDVADRDTYRRFRTLCRHIYGHLQDTQSSAQTLFLPFLLCIDYTPLSLSLQHKRKHGYFGQYFLAFCHTERCIYLDGVFLLILSVTITVFIFCLTWFTHFELVFCKNVCKAGTRVIKILFYLLKEIIVKIWTCFKKKTPTVQQNCVGFNSKF